MNNPGRGLVHTWTYEACRVIMTSAGFVFPLAFAIVLMAHSPTLWGLTDVLLHSGDPGFADRVPHAGVYNVQTIMRIWYFDPEVTSEEFAFRTFITIAAILHLLGMCFLTGILVLGLTLASRGKPVSLGLIGAVIGKPIWLFRLMAAVVVQHVLFYAPAILVPFFLVISFPGKNMRGVHQGEFTLLVTLIPMLLGWIVYWILAFSPILVIDKDRPLMQALSESRSYTRPVLSSFLLFSFGLGFICFALILIPQLILFDSNQSLFTQLLVRIGITTGPSLIHVMLIAAFIAVAYRDRVLNEPSNPPRTEVAST